MLKTINVTEDHIINGRRLVANSCPVALALKGAGVIIGANGGVTPGYIVLYDENDKETTILAPGEVTRFVKDFDSGQENLAPFSFELDIPEEFLKG